MASNWIVGMDDGNSLSVVLDEVTFQPANGEYYGRVNTDIVLRVPKNRVSYIVRDDSFAK